MYLTQVSRRRRNKILKISLKHSYRQARLQTCQSSCFIYKYEYIYFKGL